MRKLYIILFIIAILTTGCSSRVHYTKQKDLKSYFEDAGYSVEEFTEIGDITGISRLVAVLLT